MLQKVKSQKLHYLILAFVALFVGLLLPSATTAATQPSGKFGQPHGYTLSGDFTFIVGTKGTVDRVIFKIVKANDINNVLVNREATSVSNGTDGTKYFNLVWNSTGMSNGDYKLFADVECDSCTANGFRDFATHYDGKNHLAFKVDNPAVVVTPPTKPPENVCSARLENAKKRATAIYQKHKTTLLYIDNFFQQTTLFYENKNLEIENHDATLNEIGQLRKTASDSILVLEKQKDFNCDGNLKDQVQAYLKSSAETRNDLDEYKDSVINLILGILEAL